ncbi:MAG: hypothetical protein ACK58T_29275 [Phycisphaerae bacterium]
MTQQARVEAIEAARAAILPALLAELRPTLLARCGSNVPPAVLGKRLRQVFAGIRYVRDRDDASVPGREVVKDPRSILRHAGGDCEDLNLFTAGAAFRICSPGTPLASVYWPTLHRAHHVFLAYWAHGQWRVVDLVDGSRDEVWDGKGALLLWK